MKLDVVDIICFVFLALSPFLMAYGLIKGEEEKLEWYSHHCETIGKLKYGKGRNRMKTDELIEMLEAIHKRCKEYGHCSNCPMFIWEGEETQGRCQITWFFGNLTINPKRWNMERIKEIANR